MGFGWVLPLEARCLMKGLEGCAVAAGIAAVVSEKVVTSMCGKFEKSLGR